MTIKEQFSSFQYDFFTTRGFKFYDISTTNTLHGYKNQSSDIVCVQNEQFTVEPDIEKDGLYRRTIVTPLDKNDLLNYKRYYYSFHTGETKELSKQCYFDFFKANPHKAKDILNSCTCFTSEPLSEVYFQLFDIFDKETMLGYLTKCLASSFRLMPDISKIQDKLEHLDFTENEKIVFWDNYLRNRKQDLNKPLYSHKYCQFLLKEFNHDEQNLSLFFPYFRQLHAQFKEIEFSFMENENMKTTTIMVNLSKMLKGFNISDWKEDRYEKWMDKLTPAIAQFFNASYHEATYVNKSKRHYRMLFSHVKSEFACEKKIETIIKEFFIHLKSNQDVSYSEQEMQTWLYQNHLNNSLPEKTSERSKRKI